MESPDETSYSSSTKDSKQEKMFQWMAIASMMDDDDGPNNAEVALLKEMEEQNKAIMALRGKYSMEGAPYNNRALQKIELLEQKLMENKKVRSAQNPSYFFNQMMMMMMMNPSKTRCIFIT